MNHYDEMPTEPACRRTIEAELYSDQIDEGMTDEAYEELCEIKRETAWARMDPDQLQSYLPSVTIEDEMLTALFKGLQRMYFRKTALMNDTELALLPFLQDLDRLILDQIKEL